MRVQLTYKTIIENTNNKGKQTESIKSKWQTSGYELIKKITINKISKTPIPQ